MKKKNVYIIDLGTGSDRSLLPLSCGLLASFANSIPEIKENFSFHILMLETTFEDLIKELHDPEVIGLTSYCWNGLGVSEISKRIKKKYPYCQIVWGGPQVPTDSDSIVQFLNSYPEVDILVHGEGEVTFSELLTNILHNIPLDDCAGISFRKPGSLYPSPGILITEARPRIENYDEIPSPFLTGLFDSVFERYGSMLYGIPWETNRGCPFRCTFCDWGSALVNKVRHFDVDRVLAEAEWAVKKQIGYIYCTDANFGMKKERDLGIANRVAKLAINYGYPKKMVLNWTKNTHETVTEIAEVFINAGIMDNGITLAYQSLHAPTLAAIDRRNIKPEYLHKIKKIAHQRNLGTYHEIILALPEETYDTYIDGIEHSVSTNELETLSIYLCRILVNTQLRLDKEKYKLQTVKCAVGLNRRRMKYERLGEDEIVVATSTMPLEDWKKLYELSFWCQGVISLRICFFVLAFLKEKFHVKFTDFLLFILDHVDDRYPSFNRALVHVRKNRQAILDGIATTIAVEGDSTIFDPHDAIVFLLLSETEQTYLDLNGIVHEFCLLHNINISEELLDDLIAYQKLVIPQFEGSDITHVFKTNIPEFFESSDKENFVIKRIETKVVFSNNCCSALYDDEKDFNKRRVANGYNIMLNKRDIIKNGHVKNSS